MVLLAMFDTLTMSWVVLRKCTFEEALRALTYYRHMMPMAHVQVINQQKLQTL